MESTPVSLVDMESRLREDEAGVYRDSLCRTFQDEMATVKRQLDGGLPPHEFDAATKLQKALGDAITVIENCWKVEHATRRMP